MIQSFRYNSAPPFSETLGMTRTQKGLAAAICSNLLFAALFLYSSWMQPMSGTDVFMWRMVAMLFGLLALLSLTRSWRQTTAFAQSLGKSPKRWLWLLLPTPILASQLWLFMWAPVNGEGINVAMGYFLFPLMMVLLGNVWFKERLAPLQWLAVALACAGVTHELWRNGTFSWVTVWVFGSYPLYYLMRRAQGVPALTGLFFDLLLIAPLALLYLLWQADSLALIAGQPWLIGFIVLLGLNSALAMQLNLQASQMLPFSLFGMLSYLEPILLFALSLILLNEQTPQGAFISYGLIWLGLALMVWHGMRRGGKRLFNFKQNSLNNQ